MPGWIRGFAWRTLLPCLVILALGAAPVAAQYRSYVVPGRGQKVKEVGDDFEDEAWEYLANGEKASTNIDHQDRLPAGISRNNRVYESTYRGQPDIVKRVETPPGGLPGSKGALLMRSRQTGIPGYPSRKQQQDDLLINVSSMLGSPVPVSVNPSVVTRVYLPPFDQWEKRTGTHFGFRAELETTIFESKSRKRKELFSSIKSYTKIEPYWPGFFIQFNSRFDGKNKEDSAIILIRSGDRGEDLFGPTITKTGWWTFGMSFTSDGSVHYYASPGVDPLTEKDHIATTRPYGHSAQRLNTFFYNVVNNDDGRTWSTEWIVDDPSLYYYSR